MLDFYMFDDEQMNEWRERLEGRSVVSEITGEDMVVEWGHDELLDFLEVSESTLKVKDKNKRTQMLEARGCRVLGVDGRGKNFKVKVALIDEFFYNIMLRRNENKRVRKMPEYQIEYMRMLMDSNGLIKQGSAKVAPMLSDVTEMLASKHGLNEQAVYTSLKEVRSTLFEYRYLVKDKKNLDQHNQEAIEYAGQYADKVKMHRAYRGGYSKVVDGKKQNVKGELIKGLEAVIVSRKISKLYQEKYVALEKAFPLTGLNAGARELQMERRTKLSRTFTDSICDELGLSHIRTTYANTASMKAMVDYHAILELVLLGATFTEIKQFMAERVGFWEEYDRKNEQKKVQEFLKKAKQQEQGVEEENHHVSPLVLIASEETKKRFEPTINEETGEVNPTVPKFMYRTEEEN